MTEPKIFTQYVLSSSNCEEPIGTRKKIIIFVFTYITFFLLYTQSYYTAISNGELYSYKIHIYAFWQRRILAIFSFGMNQLQSYTLYFLYDSNLTILIYVQISMWKNTHAIYRSTYYFFQSKHYNPRLVSSTN